MMGRREDGQGQFFYSFDLDKGVPRDHSERQICADIQVNLAYRWFCKLGIEDKIPDHSVFCRARRERFRESDALRRGIRRCGGDEHRGRGWLEARRSRSMRA